MLFNVEQFANANKAPLNFALAYYGALLEGTERAIALNIETTRSVLLDAAGGAKAMLDAQDAGKVALIQATISQALAEKLAAYSRAFLELATHAQEDMVRAVASQANDYQRSMAQLVQMFASVAPGSPETAAAAIREFIAAGNRSVHKVGKPLAKAA